jgi:hypothetical protein
LKEDIDHVLRCHSERCDAARAKVLNQLCNHFAKVSYSSTNGSNDYDCPWLMVLEPPTW